MIGLAWFTAALSAVSEIGEAEVPMALSAACAPSNTRPAATLKRTCVPGSSVSVTAPGPTWIARRTKCGLSAACHVWFAVMSARCAMPATVKLTVLLKPSTAAVSRAGPVASAIAWASEISSEPLGWTVKVA